MASFEEQATNAAAALSEMGYEYRDGKLTDTTTGEGFAWKGQQHYDQLSDCVLTYVQDALLVSPECGLQKMEVPPPEGADEDCPRSFVYCSADFETNTDKLLVLIQGTGRVRAGVWGCALCINDTLQNGTMDGYLRSAREQGYAVVILNPNMNHTADDTVIPGSQSKEGHTVHAWDTLVSKSPASNLYVVGHSYGGVCTCALLAHRWDEIRPRLRSIAFTDSVHSPQQLKDDQLSLLGSDAVCNWVTSEQPLDTVLASRAGNGCQAVSAGTKDHASTNYTSMESVFELFTRCTPATAEAAAPEAPQEGPREGDP